MNISVAINRIALALAALLAGVGVACAQAESLKGLCGQALAAAVAEAYAPGGKAPGTAILPVWLGGGTTIRLVPPAWTGGVAIDDIFNLVGASKDFADVRKDAVPGEPHTVTAQTDAWQTGLATLAETEIAVWAPADDRRGDIARRYMYLSVIYQRELWYGVAPMFMADGAWPLFTAYGRRLMLEWHRADPVDEREAEEAARYGAMQLNSNPFVEMPDLAEHIWGDRATEGFIPPAQHERCPLKGRYSRSADTAIDLYSQYVPDDVQWTLDGTAVDAESVPLDALSNGAHILRFTSGKLRGKIKIEICD